MKIATLSVLVSMAWFQTVEAQTFMTEDELMDTIPGATVTGIANSDGKTRWTQEYSERDGNKTKGTIKGDFGGDRYSATWRIKRGKWCEDWGSGNACWDMERVDDSHIRLYQKGKPLEHLWEIL